MKLYGYPMSPNARRVQLTLEELELPYEYVTVDLVQGEHKKPDYLALNPFGRVPTLVDGELVLWESHAICQYLAAKKPAARLDGGDATERAEVARWMFHNAAHFGPSFARVFAHTIRIPEDQRIPRVAEEARADATRTLAVLDRALEGRDWLVGGRITIADISFAPSLAFAPMLGFDLSAYPRVAALLERIRARPAFKKVAG